MRLVYYSFFATGYGLPASSNIFQRFALPSSISKHELERHWCFIEGWHVCAFVCVCVVALFYVANHLHCFAVCTAWPFIQRLHSFSLFLQLLQILSERGGWSVDLTFAGNSCCNSCWVLWWCGSFASENYTLCNCCAWSQHLVGSKKNQEIGAGSIFTHETQWKRSLTWPWCDPPASIRRLNLWIWQNIM